MKGGRKMAISPGYVDRKVHLYLLADSEGKEAFAFTSLKAARDKEAALAYKPLVWEFMDGYLSPFNHSKEKFDFSTRPYELLLLARRLGNWYCRRLGWDEAKIMSIIFKRRQIAGRTAK